MLENLTCQKYRDGTFEEAADLGCDCFQPKFDGWWTHAKWRHSDLELFSKTGRHFDTKKAPGEYWADLVAETMHGTQWAQDESRKGKVYIFDVWGLVTEDIRQFPYRERMRRLNVLWKNFSILPDPLRVIPTLPMTRFRSFWDTQVVTGLVEGVVFRKSGEAGTPELIRAKNELTAELQVVGFVPGEGKFEGILGAIEGRGIDGTRVDVGGGFSDAQRKHIMENPELYLHRWFSITAKAKFESGSFRHPNFKCWREDLE